MYSSSLLAHLTKNFAPHPENVATEALGQVQEGGGQGRVEPRRTFRQSGLHRHQPQLSNEGDCQLLQWQSTYLDQFHPKTPQGPLLHLPGQPQPSQEVT